MSGTDWERLINMTDEEALKNALDDPDNPPLEIMETPLVIPMRDLDGKTLIEKFDNLRKRRFKQSVTIRYDADVLEYFRSKGKGYQTLMNNALRAFMEAEQAQRQDG